MTAVPNGRAVVVGDGFAGVARAPQLASARSPQVPLIDRNAYHQFEPLPSQVATRQLAPVDDSLPVGDHLLERSSLEAR